MNFPNRGCSAIAVAALVLAAVPQALNLVQPSGVAHADVCMSAGRRVTVGGCADLGNAIAPYAPGPYDYMPMPEDYTPNVDVCASVGRRVSVGGCV
ncbi:hypothetical protein [Mycobacterium sp.]|uniref:hypothetical protein n=1 Tax=Mycobacterium sp. TaxID=1785 RepID=UPI003A83C4AC